MSRWASFFSFAVAAPTLTITPDTLAPGAQPSAWNVTLSDIISTNLDLTFTATLPVFVAHPAFTSNVPVGRGASDPRTIPCVSHAASSFWPPSQGSSQKIVAALGRNFGPKPIPGPADRTILGGGVWPRTLRPQGHLPCIHRLYP